jgi:TonB-like protein
MSDKRSPSLAIVSALCIASTVFVTVGLQPAFAKLASPVQTLSETLRKRAAESKVKSLAVADFVTTGGSASPEGLYFADLLYSYLDEPPKRFTLLHRDAVGHFLDVHNIAPGSLATANILEQAGESLGAGVILTRTVGAGEQSLVIHALLIRVADGNVIGDASTVIPQDAFNRTLRTHPEPPKLSTIISVTDKGVHAPEFLDLPAPQFRGPADAKNSGSETTFMVSLLLTISAEGRLASLQVGKGGGPEFSEIAWRSARAWRFKPGVDRSGTPVALQIPMQVIFHIY